MLRKTFSVIMLVLLLANMLAVTSNIRLIKAELTTIRVPEDFPTIQEAINAATPGNIIFVKAGIYRENVIVNKAVSLVGEDPATTIIDGGGVGTVVNITADNVRLTGFTIQNSSLEFGFYAGVYLRKAHYCNISENIIKTNGQIGIYLLGSSYNIISRNNITHNGNGIWLTAIQEGYFVDFTLYNIIANNNITSNYYSLNLVYSSYNNVSGNNIAKSQYGVWIEDSVDNTFLENSIVENGFYGVYLTGYKSANNRFYHNSFINNSRHVYSDGCVSVWDNGYPYGGNYWSDYKGVDEKSGPNQDKPGSDGIGDTPYIIDSNNVDNYPLMNPYEQQIMGPPGTYVWIYWKRDNNYNFDVDLNVTDAPDVVGSGQVIFWAHQFGFVNGSGGYLGLQIVGSQKKVIFSIWDAITGEPGNPFQEGDGHGWQIIINYDWKLNRKYRLRIWEFNVEQNGDEWWLAAVYDYASGVDTIIGKILVPAAWGWLDATSLTWVEYAGYDNCESQNIPYSRAEFSNLFARNTAGDSGPIKLKVYYGLKPAKNSDVDYYGGGTYALEAGDDVFRDTPEIWLTDLHVQLCMHVCSIPNNAFFITRYDSPIPCRSTESYLAVPANLQTTIMVRGSLYYGGSNPEKQNLISGKEVRLFIDGELVSTFVTNENSPNLEGVVNITLPEGLHDCEIRSEGDETFSSSFESFKIIAYKSSEFYMGRDSFQFENWEYTFEEHQMLLGKLLEEGMIDQSIKYPLVAIFPILSAPGHCFGMAAASSVYNINPNLKPKAVSTYELLKEDAIWDIEFYQILVIVQTLHGNALSSQLNDIKRCIDSGTPILLSYSIPEFTHTITVIGYYQEKDETFLVCYDNRSPDSIYLYSVVDGKLLYIWENKHINITNVALTDPRSIPAPISSVDLTSALKELFEAYLGISIHSPVNIKIMDENGNEFVTENNTIVRNDISDAYFYISEEAKIVLLPSNRTYSISIIGTDFGQVDIDLTSVVGNDIFTYQFHNIPINYGDKIYVNSTQPEIAYFDSSGDGTIDKEIYAEVVPEFPSIVISTSLILTGLIIIVLLKKRRKIQP